MNYNMIMSTAESTVVTEYEPQQTRSDAYQSEAALENAFIKMLTEQGYQYLKIDSPSALIDNLRKKKKKLNNYNGEAICFVHIFVLEYSEKLMFLIIWM